LRENEIYEGETQVFTIMGSHYMDCRHYGTEKSNGKFSMTVDLMNPNFSDNQIFSQKFIQKMVMISKVRRPARRSEWDKSVLKLAGVTIAKRKTIRSKMRNLLIGIWYVGMAVSVFYFIQGIIILNNNNNLPEPFTIGLIGFVIMLFILVVDYLMT